MRSNEFIKYDLHTKQKSLNCSVDILDKLLSKIEIDKLGSPEDQLSDV